MKAEVTTVYVIRTLLYKLEFQYHSGELYMVVIPRL